MPATSLNAAKQNYTAQGVVDNTGTCVLDFTIPPVYSGSYCTGSITAWDSPNTATWVIILSGTPVDQTIGPQTIQGIQVGTNDTLQIKATGLVSNIGQTIHATFAAIVTPANNTDLIVPGHDGLVLPQQYQQPPNLLNLPSQAVGTSVQIFTINVPPCIGLLAEIQNLTPGSGDIQVVVQDPSGAYTYSTFWKASADSFTTWWEIFPFTAQVQYRLNATAPVQVFFNVWAIQQDMMPFIPPRSLLYTQTLAASSVGTAQAGLAAHGKVGMLSAEVSVLGVGPPAGPWKLNIYNYVGGGTYHFIAGIGGGNEQTQDTKSILTPPGSLEIIPVNLSTTANLGINMAWTQ